MRFVLIHNNLILKITMKLKSLHIDFEPGFNMDFAK